MELNDLRVFTRVAELGSFTQAAEQLGLAKSRVSTVVRQLEARVGARLLQRTTRHVRLTTDGEQFLDRCGQLIADAEQLQGMFRPAASGLRGRLRVDMPNVLARDLVIPRLPEFLASHPQLELAISTTDRHVDLVQEGFDCVLRIGALADAELIARPLGMMPMRNLASPAYLQAHGVPTCLADLARHRIVHYSTRLSPHGASWEYCDGDTVRQHPVRKAIIVNGTEAYSAACLAGLGLIQVPVPGSQPLVDAGRLVEVLPEFTAAPMPVSLVYPHRRQLAPRVQAFLQWITQVVEPYLGG
ncbi:LysR substrate-binding domain-containing protein [Lysobacter sp. F60174L2]|uniref:LysR substrate-binding domain-containing protein n=1 Tax=Lysobacter sp. F60174L2 TaxID=3459295 RepID=UPI00403D8316